MARGGVHGGGVCVAGEHAWGVFMAGGACMAGWSMCGGGVCDRRDGHCNGRYASYWNAFFCLDDIKDNFATNT